MCGLYRKCELAEPLAQRDGLGLPLKIAHLQFSYFY
ncbi:hypothetical protein ACPR111641_10390 [Acinetobacter pragensis]